MIPKVKRKVSKTLIFSPWHWKSFELYNIWYITHQHRLWNTPPPPSPMKVGVENCWHITLHARKIYTRVIRIFDVRTLYCVVLAVVKKLNGKKTKNKIICLPEPSRLSTYSNIRRDIDRGREAKKAWIVRGVTSFLRWPSVRYSGYVTRTSDRVIFHWIYIDKIWFNT